MHKIDVSCTEAAAVTTLPDSLFTLLAVTVFFPETSCFKLRALMSVRRNCAATLVEIILGYQSKIPAKPLSFTACDNCDCVFPVPGLLLAAGS